MPVSQLLVQQPSRQTANPQKDSSSDSSGPSGDVSFAPQLQKAKEQKSASKPSANDSDTNPSSDVTASAAAGTLKKTSAKSADFKAIDVEDVDASQPPAKTKAPNSVTESAPAETTTHVDKKAAKPQKAAAKSSTPTKQTVHGVQPNQHPDQKIVTPVVAAASGSGGQQDGTSPDVEDNSDADGSANVALSFGGGFYGSAKVVARQGSVANDENAAEAATGGDDSATTAVATAIGDDLTASPNAEIDTNSVIEKPATPTDSRGNFADTLSAFSSTPATTSTGVGKTHAVSTPQASFVEENHPKIVDSIQGQLLPRGGTMQLQLHPADLGSMQVTVEMKDGVMSASFQTSNEAATKMLTRSLGQLKTGLEAVGVSVEKLHVEQTSQGDAKSGTGDGNSQTSQDQQQQSRQDQQRREMVKQMWKKLSGADPLDLVA